MEGVCFLAISNFARTVPANRPSRRNSRNKSRPSHSCSCPQDGRVRCGRCSEESRFEGTGSVCLCLVRTEGVKPRREPAPPPCLWARTPSRQGFFELSAEPRITRSLSPAVNTVRHGPSLPSLEREAILCIPAGASMTAQVHLHGQETWMNTPLSDSPPIPQPRCHAERLDSAG